MKDIPNQSFHVESPKACTDCFKMGLVERKLFARGNQETVRLIVAEDLKIRMSKCKKKMVCATVK